MTCACGYTFCFDPKADGMSDGKFLASIRNASSNDAGYFTANQLYTVMCRRMFSNPRGCLIVALIAAVAGVGLFFISWKWAVAAAVFAVVSLIIAAVAMTKTLSRAQFDSWLGKWRRKKSDPPRLLVEPRLHDPPPDWTEADIYDYGVEALVVVERDLIVDLLVLNGFHTANRALVVAESGYPEYLIPVANRLLDESSDLPVYLLHDSGERGEDMHRRVLESNRLAVEGRSIIDLGLMRDDVKRMKRLRPVRPEESEFAVPVDTVPWGRLSTLMGVCLVEHAAFGALLDRAADVDAGAVFDFG